MRTVLEDMEFGNVLLQGEKGDGGLPGPIGPKGIPVSP